MFRKYIEKKTKFPNQSITEEDVTKLWNAQLKQMPRNHFIWKLQKKAHTMKDIVQKVQTIIRSERNKAKTALRKEMEIQEVFEARTGKGDLKKRKSGQKEESKE